jgi:hypothetical protein
MRFLIKAVLVLALSFVAVRFGGRWLTGRTPSPRVLFTGTFALFALILAADAMMGW